MATRALWNGILLGAHRGPVTNACRSGVLEDARRCARCAAFLHGEDKGKTWCVSLGFCRNKQLLQSCAPRVLARTAAQGGGADDLGAQPTARLSSCRASSLRTLRTDEPDRSEHHRSVRLFFDTGPRN